MKTLTFLCCLVGAMASASYGKKETSYTYHGKYPGKCSNDGLYYQNEKSFVFCSNGNSYVQNCAPGSRNSGYEKLSYGSRYSSRDLCDVNLVDSGYNVKHAPKYEAPKYEEPKYEAPEYDEPKYEAPKYEAPKYEAPKYKAPKYEAPKYEDPKYEEPKYEEHSDAYIYHGKYPGQCQYDGLYFKDEYSFVFCSNINSYIQPCAPGTKNSAYEKFSYGSKYSYRDFCDVNLVDGGYASHDSYGYEHTKPSYKPAHEEHKYEEPKYEALKHEAPTYDAPKYEEPKYEEPKYEAPTFDAPKYEEPKYEAPTYDAPKYEEPKYEEPKYEESKSEAPTFDAPKYDEPKYEEPKYEEPKYEAPTYDAPKYEEPKYEATSYDYHGMYPGKCQYDGLYYNDAKSFIFCVSGNSYVQPCAPGTLNSGYSKFSYGKSYSRRDFCDVNLVDGGYGANHAVYH